MEKAYSVARHVAFWSVFVYGFTMILAHMCRTLASL